MGRERERLAGASPCSCLVPPAAPGRLSSITGILGHLLGDDEVISRGGIQDIVLGTEETAEVFADTCPEGATGQGETTAPQGWPELSGPGCLAGTQSEM